MTLSGRNARKYFSALKEVVCHFSMIVRQRAAIRAVENLRDRNVFVGGLLTCVRILQRTPTGQRARTRRNIALEAFVGLTVYSPRNPLGCVLALFVSPCPDMDATTQFMSFNNNFFSWHRRFNYPPPGPHNLTVCTCFLPFLAAMKTIIHFLPLTLPAVFKYRADA
jgi:hypothetical protein